MGTNRALKIALVEDDPIFSHLITKSIEKSANSEVLASVFSSGKGILDSISKKMDFDLFLIDLGLPDMLGVELIEQISTLFPETPIMVLSVLTSEISILNSIKAGARGYISKSDSIDSIIHAIGEVLKGNHPISPMLARYLFKLVKAESFTTDLTKNNKSLSKRELEVLQEISIGSEYKEIAKKLNISITTIQTHIRKIYKKLQVHSKIQAISKAKSLKILSF